MDYLPLSLSSEAFMPHGHCYFWDPFVLWSHAISDSVIALAYFIIPFSLVEIVRKRNDFRYMWLIVLFALFILGCGATHLMDVIVIWEPWYYTDSAFRIITALASIGTAFMLIKITPRLILIPSAERWQQMNEDLRQLNESLEKKVESRTAALAESAATFEFVTDTIPQLVWTAPKSGQLDYFNQNWFQYTGFTYDQSKGKGWQQLIHPDDREKVVQVWQKSVKSGEKFEIECQLRNHDNGRYRWHLLRALAMKDREGQVSKWFGTATDIHEQKTKSEELIKVNEELDNFVYTASHDLKAPLTNLEGLVRIMHKSAEGERSAEGLVPMMEHQVSRLRLIISDLADVGRIEKEAVEDFEQVSVAALIEEFKELNHESVKVSRATFVTNIQANGIYFSTRHLRSILHNLIDNAIKYHKLDTPPVIEISSYFENEYWKLAIRDNGIGIEDTARTKVFEMFKRFNRDTEGTGIGLYIIKRVAEKYGGAAWVDSQPGEGSTFWVKIPAEVVTRDITATS